MASDPPPPYSSPYSSSKPLRLSQYGYTLSPPAPRSPLQSSSYCPPPAPHQHRAPHHSPNHTRPGSGSGSAHPSPAVSRAPSSGSGGTHRSTRDDPRAARRRIAAETLAAIKEGIYRARDGTTFNLRRRVRAMTAGVRYYAPDEKVVMPGADAQGRRRMEVEVVHETTLDAARRLEGMHWRAARAARAAETVRSVGEEEKGWDWGIDEKKRPADAEGSASQSMNRGKGGSPAQLPLIGILSSAAPTDPSASFLAGEDGQELSIARASTLSAALKTRTALPFYHPAVKPAGAHAHGARGASTQAPYHTHAMVYAPGVSVIRDEQGAWTPPMAVDVITCTAVHAGDARAAARPDRATIEAQIARTTTERLRRVLAVFAAHAVHTLVLPAFGAGNFRNDIAAVARIYAALLVAPNAPFAGVFDRVVFAITPEAQWRAFEEAFWGAVPGGRRGHEAGISGAQEDEMRAPRTQRNLQTLREEVPENSDGRSIRSPPDARVATTPRLQLRPPKYVENAASVGDWRLSLQGLSLQDGRATVMSRRNNHSANESSSEINGWRSSAAESQDGALEYV